MCMKCHETYDGLMVMYMLGNCVVEGSNLG